MLEEKKVAYPLLFKLFNSEEEPFRHSTFIMVLSVNAYKTPAIALLTAALLFHGKKKSILCVHICILVCLCVCLHFIERENIAPIALKLLSSTVHFTSIFLCSPLFTFVFCYPHSPSPPFLSLFSSFPSHISISPTPAHVIVI